MRGSRLLIGVFAMGIAVPAVLFYLLDLDTFSEFFTVAATCFLAWGVADLAANIVARPQRAKRSASEAVREWERHKEARAGRRGKES